MGGERGVPLSKAALDICTEKKLVDAKISEANAKVQNWVSFELDPHFEDSTLKSEDGVYKDVFSGFSYKDYKVGDAAQTLMDGVNEALGN